MVKLRSDSLFGAQLSFLIYDIIIICIMHHQSQVADLVDVLAVDFDIVDRLGDSRKRNALNDRKTIEPLECLAVGKLS